MTALRGARRLLLALTALLGAATVVLTVLCVVTDARPLVFRSGSMSPTIPTGSLAFARPAEASTLQVGDVVSVAIAGDSLVTHRILAISRHDDVALLQLKGDANPAADAQVYPVRDVQKVWWSVPGAGYAVSWLATPVGSTALFGVVALALLTLFRRRTPAGSGKHRVARAPGSRAGLALVALLNLSLGVISGWAAPTWAYWSDDATVSGTTISTGTWDVAAPTTVVSNIGPAANAAGWHKTNVAVTLTATDPAPSSGVAKIEYTVNGGAVQTLVGTSGVVNLSTEGTNTIEFWATDNAGFVESPHKTQVIRIDKTLPGAPSFTSISSDTGASSTDRITSAASQTLTGNAEPNATVTVKQGAATLGTVTANGAGVFTYGPVTLTAGTNTFTATATDIADNTGPASAGFNVTLDGVEPFSVVISPNDTAWHTSGAWTVTANDALSGIASVSTKVDAGSYATVVASNGTPVAPTALSDGTHTVFAYATDVAGKTTSSTPVNATIKVDGTKPTASLSLATEVGGWRTSGLATITGSDATSGLNHLEYRIDVGSFLSVASGASFTIPEGTHSVTYRAVDNAGNVSTDVLVSNIKIDSVKPVTSITPVSSTTIWRTSTSVTLAATDATSGVASIGYKIDGAATYTTYAGAIALAQGTHTVTYRAIDNAGNVEADQTATIKVDSVVPIANVSQSGFGQPTLSATDATSGVASISWRDGNSGAYTTVAGVGPLTLSLSDGVHTLWRYATDNAGNQSTPVSSTFTVDATAPTVTVTPSAAPNANGYWTADVTVTIASTDSASGVVQQRYRTSTNGGASWSAYTTDSSAPFTQGLTVTTNGETQIQYEATDAAGNIRTGTYTVKLDKAGPTTTITNPSSGGSYQQNGTPGCNTNGVWDICGTATDPASGVDRVELELRHNGVLLTTDKCLDSAGNWTNAACSTNLTATIDGSGNWSYVTGALPGNGILQYSGYTLTVYVYDGAGNLTTLTRNFG